MRTLIVIGILGVAMCPATPIIVSVATCSVPGSPTQSGSNSCFLTGTFGANPPTAGASVSGAVSGLGSSQFSMTGSANTHATDGGSEPGDCCDLEGEAEARVSYSDTLQTPGPVRQGWILYSVTASGFSVDGGADANFHVGPYVFDNDLSPPFGCFTNCLEPFTLGEYFNVSMMVDAGEGGGDIGSNQARGLATFSLFESDGVTPVVIQESSEPESLAPESLAPESPEPESLALAALGLVGLFMAKIRKHYKQRQEPA
jgi:hypothetical protein